MFFMYFFIFFLIFESVNYIYTQSIISLNIEIENYFDKKLPSVCDIVYNLAIVYHKQDVKRKFINGQEIR